jgi:hypothetical protein
MFIRQINMKNIAFLLSGLFFFSVSFSQKAAVEIQKSNRIEKVINSQWTFNYFSASGGNKGYESPGFDDSRWVAISIPHTWSTFETTGELHPFIRNTSENDYPYWWTGWGWYRKHFSVKKEYSDRKIFIEFEGVQKYCKVWINGKFLGDHKGGYGSFDFDITQFVRLGEDNVIAVAVNSRQKDDFGGIPPLSSSGFDVYGGIYRDVILVLTDRLFIPMQGSANHEGGTFITTPRVSAKEGVVRVQTWVKNDNPQKKSCTLLTSISDASDKIVQVLKSESVIEPGQVYKFDQTFKPIKNPHLWSVENPFLYKVNSQVTDGNTITDALSSPLGFRWFTWNAKENCLYLNGKKMIMNGGNRHQDFPWLGDATPKWITLMDLKDISENLKFNFLQTGNYPNDKYVYDLTDKSGIVVQEEIPGVDNNDVQVSIKEQQIMEMVRRDRNHPSILLWNVGNESAGTPGSKFLKSEDSTRILMPRFLNKPDENLYADHGADIDLPNSPLLHVDPNGRVDPYRIPKEAKSGKTQNTETSEKPAMIILSGSHDKIFADRSSVVIVKADIVDSKGKHVPGVDNTIKWSLTGPATLVGPSVYESDKNKRHEMEGSWYLGMPVSNIIRSTGKPGKIHLSVSASGLTSGSLDIIAEEPLIDNSVITETVLRDEGRIPVAKILMKVNRLDDVPREIKAVTSELNLGSTDKSGYKKLIINLIVKDNPLIDTSLIEFKALTELLAFQLLNSNGHLNSDDYNFNADHYNNCRLISGYINSTKLPPLFKDGLRKYYSDAIIIKGNEKNAGEEMNWLNWIPSGGTVVVVPDEKSNVILKGAIVSRKTGLLDVIAVVYPQFTNFSREAKDRALLFITKANPYIHQDIVEENGKQIISYSAEKGQPILIPLLKFISE